MSARLPALSARQLVRVLRQHGFQLVRQSGSHMIFKHPDGRRTRRYLSTVAVTYLGVYWRKYFAMRAYRAVIWRSAMISSQLEKAERI